MDLSLGLGIRGGVLTRGTSLAGRVEIQVPRPCRSGGQQGGGSVISFQGRTLESFPGWAFDALH